MSESIFSIVLIAFSVVAIGFVLYIIFIFLQASFSMWQISRKGNSFLDKYKNETKEEKEYRLYIKSQGLKLIAKDNFEAPKEQVKRELEACCEFIEKNPDNIYSIEKRIFLNSCLKEYQNIVNDYKILIEKVPSKFEYVSMCAQYYALMHDLRMALNLINNFYVDKEKDDKYFNAIGDVLRSVEDYKLAIENYTKAIELNPEHSFYYVKRSLAYKAIKQMDKYQEDRKKFEEIARAPKESKTQDDTLESETSKLKKEDKARIVDIIKMTIWLFAFFAVVYFHPTKEVLNCTPQQTCEVQKTYFGLFKVKKKLNLKYNSNLTCTISACSADKRHTYYGLYIRIDDISPFVFYIADSTYYSYDYQIEELSKKCEFYHQEFIRYLNNYGKFSYVLNSKASIDKLILSLIFVFAFFLILFYEKVEKIGKKLKQKKL